MKKIFWNWGLIGFIAMSVTVAAFGQDPVFSQFFASPLQMNPAFAGTTHGAKVALNYRNQWPGLNSVYQTYAVSYDQYFSDLNSGFGASVLTDDAGNGLFKTTSFNLSYSYKVAFSRSFQMRFGVEGGLINSRLDWTRLTFVDQIDPEFGSLSPGGLPYPTEEVVPANASVTAFDISMGLLAFNEYFYGGISLKHLNSPDLLFLESGDEFQGVGLPLRISLQAGSEVHLGEPSKYSRSLIYWVPNIQFVHQTSFNQLNIGSFFRYDLIAAGIWYRQTTKNPDSVIFLAGLQRNNYKLNYSYDMTISQLRGTGGAHEISLIYIFDFNRRESRYNDCFNMFR